MEDRVKELEELNLDKNAQLLVENDKLKEMIVKLQNENAALLGTSISFDYPLSTLDDNRPQKIIRSAGIAEASPVAYFDSLSSGYSTSSKSRSNTPEISPVLQQPQQLLQPTMSIDDILGLDNSMLPSDALLDRSELLGFNSSNDYNKNEYSTQLDDILNQHRFPFTTDPSQFDFFYPLEATNNQTLNTVPSPEAKEEEEEGIKHINTVTHVWDKVSEHPRFDEIDMDILCDEMKKKAVCYEMNPDRELQKALDKFYPVQ